MVKIIGIFAIVFVYYCEIHAEVDNLQHGKKTTRDVRRIMSKKQIASNKSDVIWFRNNAARPHAKFTTGFREDIRGPHNEYVLMNGEARYNDLEHHVVKKRRFKRNDRDLEQNQIHEHDNDTEKPKKEKTYHHDSQRKMNKNHKSTRNKKTKRYKKNTKRKDMEQKDNEDMDKKHRHPLGRKMNRSNKSIRKKKTKRSKKKNEDMNKHKKLNKEKNHSGKKNKDKKQSKNSEHTEKEKDHIKKKDQAEDKSKDEQREKSMDRNKNATIGGPLEILKMITTRHADEKDHKQNKKQLLNKSNEKQGEKSKHTIDPSKAAIGMAGLAAAGLALVGKSLASLKDLKLQPEHVITSTTTPKTSPKPVQEEEVVTEKKLKKRDRWNLRTQEKARVTRMVPFSMYKQEDEGVENLRLKAGAEGGRGSPPSNLSPYAITAQMELLMKEFPNVNATISKSGRTVEYNDIVLVRITEKKEDETYFRVKESKYIDDVPEKKIIFIVHGLTVMGMKDMTSLINTSELKLLLSYYLKHLDKFDFFLMPLANPDGYSASLSSDRAIWNKNVSPQSVCSGVFVDRNFDVGWNSSKQISSCSQLYPGATPFSEEESKAVRDVFHQYSHKILAYIHVHAGTFDDKVFKGDAILYPRGYTQSQSDDDKYIDIKGEVDEAMKNASFRVMSATVDTLSNWYGVVSGTSVDYAATVYGIPYAMEFVMQLYDSESLNNNALTEIWSRLIDATFNNMWKNLQAGSDARRFCSKLT